MRQVDEIYIDADDFTVVNRVDASPHTGIPAVPEFNDLRLGIPTQPAQPAARFWRFPGPIIEHELVIGEGDRAISAMLDLDGPGSLSLDVIERSAAGDHPIHRPDRFGGVEQTIRHTPRSGARLVLRLGDGALGETRAVGVLVRIARASKET